MEKEVMDALCMLHDLARARKEKNFTTQDSQFKIVKEYIKKQDNRIKFFIENEIVLKK